VLMLVTHSWMCRAQCQRCIDSTHRARQAVLMVLFLVLVALLAGPAWCALEWRPPGPPHLLTALAATGFLQQ
jgi:hypothetical protein